MDWPNIHMLFRREEMIHLIICFLFHTYENRFHTLGLQLWKYSRPLYTLYFQCCHQKQRSAMMKKMPKAKLQMLQEPQFHVLQMVSSNVFCLGIWTIHAQYQLRQEEPADGSCFLLNPEKRPPILNLVLSNVILDTMRSESLLGALWLICQPHPQNLMF